MHLSKGAMSTCLPLTKSPGPLLMEVDSAATAIRWALAYLGCTRAMVQKPAISLDIDGTVLLNASDGHTKCVRHFKNLTQACEKAGVAIFYITARPDTASNRDYTERQLRDCGLNKHVKMFMMPPRAEYSRYKYGSRLKVAQMGYTIILSIGDQFADITRRDLQLEDDKFYVGQIGDNGSFGIKLPSEFLEK